MANFEKFTLAELRASVRRKLGDASYDADTIDEAANDFQYEVFNDNRIRFMESSATLTINSGDTELDFPEDFMTMLNFVILDSATSYRNITKDMMSYDEFMGSYPNFSTANASRLYRYAPFGGGIRFSAPVDAEYQAQLDYMRVPERMEADSDESELPRAYKEMAVLGTLEKVLFVDEELNTADFTLDRLGPLRTSFIRNYGRGSMKVGPMVMRTNRGRGTFRTDRDF